SCSVSLRAADDGLERVATRGDAEANVILPLRVRGRDIGVLALALGAAPGPDDLAFTEEIARRAALAVDNARLLEGERVARDRTERQYAVAAALANALTAADVAAATLAEVVPAVGAEHGTVWQVSEDGTALEVIGWRGFSAEEMAGHRRVALREPRPVADSIRARRTLWWATPEELDRAYPVLAEGLRARELRSAAAFPLLSAGRVVGGLFLSSTRPRALGPEDLALAGALAAQTAQALERARLFEAERRVSVTLQRSLLPAELPRLDGVEIDLRYLPAAGLEAGGDFYEALALPDGSLLVAVGDVVGRGAKAAAAMGQLRSALRAFAFVGERPGAILALLSSFAETVPGALAATAVIGRLDPEGRLVYACAGHPYPLLVHADGTAEFLHGGRGVPLSCTPDPAYPEATVQLGPGATVLLYTDGLTERRGQDVDALLERLRSATAECAAEPLANLLDCAVAGVADAADDVAVVGVRLTGRGAATRRLTLPAEVAQVPLARAAVREWLAGVGMASAAAGDVLLASGEAVANAVEHSGSEMVELELAAPEPGVVTVVVRDHGRWRDPVLTPHRGRGFELMRALAEEVVVERRGSGTAVSLRHRVGDGRPAVPAAAAAPARCAVTVDDGVAILRGELDLGCAAEVAERLTAAGASTVDLTGVDHLDSTGARMLLELPGRPVVVAPPGTVPRRTLELSGLTDVLDVRDS
ncbi:MAG: SpoIIE family protein phosphatase, partial [Solirubrobacteraceae bacterium]